MKAKLSFISAGAGSGKTYTLTEILYKELVAGKVKASGVIATTFTKKAATELRERVRNYLLEHGEFEQANNMGQARIGTVNAVCGDLLRRFAFEAGLPTEQTVLEEEEASSLLMRAIDVVQEGKEAAQLNALNKRFSVEKWKDDFKQLVATVRANQIDSAALEAVKQDNLRELLGFFPEPTTVNLTQELIAALEVAIDQISQSTDTTKKTRDYLLEAEQFLSGLKQDSALWREWIKFSKAEPAVRSQAFNKEVKDIAGKVMHHSQLQSDVRDYLQIQFDLCAGVLKVYQQIKLSRGVIDFTDQESQLLDLLKHPFVAATLSEELDLLMVDEFQDTSPIQLALFLRLAEFAKQVVWVGDIKQAIYGFRGSDTALMEAILQELPAMGSTKKTLEFSWRSRKPLVELVNEVFVPTFSDKLAAEEVSLIPKREEALHGAPFACWNLTGKAEVQNAYLGRALRHLVDSAYLIHDKAEGRLRPVTLGDIAIFRRSNDKVTETAKALRSVGVPAMTEQPGLLATPEAVLAVACLRRLNDPSDTLASAEIVFLVDCGEPEVWVADRLRYMATGAPANEWREVGEDAHPMLASLKQLREAMPLMSPAEALEVAIAKAQLPSVVLRWSSSADIGRVRLANLDALIEMARQYETVCAGAHHAASVSGLLLWLQLQAKDKTDSLALPAIDAVQVMTHHKAKGLEWPVVVLMDLHGEIKDGLWDKVIAYSRSGISAKDPLRDRSLRFWRWPFGAQEDTELRDNVNRSAIGAAAKITAEEEAKRILYVSMTRARDLMIFALPENKTERPWLKSLGAHWLTQVENGAITLPSGVKIPVLPLPELPELTEASADELAASATAYSAAQAAPHASSPTSPTSTQPSPQNSLYWLHEPSTRESRLPRTFNPSKAESPEMRVAESVDLGERIPLSYDLDWEDVGHAVHAAMALAFVDTTRTMAVDDVEHILTGYGLKGQIAATALTKRIGEVHTWISQRWPDADTLPEWPVEAVLDNGQVINGRIDLLIDRGSHWILIDHKSNPEDRSNWPKQANKYGGQMLAYKNAIETATNKPVQEMWLVLPMSGGAIRVETLSSL